jgi:membrane fusion protein (multidrug efflux system)
VAAIIIAVLKTNDCGSPRFGCRVRTGNGGNLAGSINQTALLRNLSLITLLLVLAGCDGQETTARPGPSGAWGGPTTVVTVAAVKRPLRTRVEALGTAVANESVTITAQVTDSVSQVRFEDGDYVNAGDVLVELTNEEETALLAEAEANARDTRTQLDRLEDLVLQGSVPISQVDEARARHSAAVARYQSVVARLEDRLITAPFSGVLGFRQVSTGTLITPGTPITTLDDVSVIKLDFSIPEIHLSRLQPGQRIEAESPAYSGSVFDATVSTIGSRVDPVTRAAVVRAHIDNGDMRLRPGMLLTARLTTSEREVLMIPEAALLQRGTQVRVFTEVDGTARSRLITHGVRDAGWVEVREGLTEGERVITDGLIKVRDGSPITTVRAEQG